MQSWQILLLAMLMTAGWVTGALAENELADTYDRLVTLAFDTENVTAELQASFELDGAVFKEINAVEIQHGSEWYRDLTLRTPMPDGSCNVSGYGILAEGETETIVDYFHHTVADTFFLQQKNGMLARSVGMNNLIALGAAMAKELQRTLPEHAVMKPDESSVKITLEQSAMPELVHPVLTSLFQYAVQAIRGINYRMMTAEGWADIEDYETVVEGIVYCTSTLTLEQAELLVCLDEQGRISSCSGTAQIDLETRSGKHHELKVTFSLAAHDYGTSVLPEVETAVGK